MGFLRLGLNPVVLLYLCMFVKGFCDLVHICCLCICVCDGFLIMWIVVEFWS